MMSYDIIGNIAIMKFTDGTPLSERKSSAEKILAKHKNITTVLAKASDVQGRLRTIKTRHLAGIKTTEAVYKENGCTFFLDVNTCYFSPRLSEERKRLVAECKRGERVMVMFGGVAPYAITIAKGKPSVKEVVSVEIGRECSKYAARNVIKNKVEGKVQIIQGDVKKQIPKLTGAGVVFDRIIMARPNLEETFIKTALRVAKKGTIIHYHGFAHENEREKMVKDLEEETKREERRVKILSVMRVGDIAPGKYRYRVNLKILN